MISDRQAQYMGSIFESTIQKIVNADQSNISLHSLTGGAVAFFIAQLSKVSSRPLLLIVDSFDSAEEFKEDLAFFMDEKDLRFFPPWDTIPYDNQSPDKLVLAQRFQTLFEVLHQKAQVTVTTPTALMQRIMPSSSLIENSLVLLTNEIYERENLLQKLVSLGFSRVEMVEERGEFSVRGSIIDIFPLGNNNPVRLDFFDDELDSMKEFDVESQKSNNPISEVLLFPAQEILFDDKIVARALKELIFYKPNTVPQIYNTVVEQIKLQTAFPGMESLLPLFYEKTGQLLDYYTQPPIIAYIEPTAIIDKTRSFFDEIKSEWEYSVREGNPTLEPDRLFLSEEMFFKGLNQGTTLHIQSIQDDVRSNFDLSTADNSAVKTLAMKIEGSNQGIPHNILEQLTSWNKLGAKVAIVANSMTRAERLQQTMMDFDVTLPLIEEKDRNSLYDFLLTPFSPKDASFCIVIGNLNRGYRWIDEEGNSKSILITEEEIFGSRKKQRHLKTSNLKHFLSSLGDLKVGDYVVHVEYGIGRYGGLKQIKTGALESDFLIIEYRGGDKVYVPVDKFHLVQKYSGGEANRAVLNKLGDKAWSKTKAKIRSEVDDMAEELVKLYAKRKTQKGVSVNPNPSLTEEFDLSFQYQETEDQEKAILDVTSDQASEQPMDRLVCGDVGFGKTEVAMRASIRAAVEGLQTGMLVPTTILAQQHYENFCKRFENSPVNIGLLSRFQTPKKMKSTLHDIKAGKVDIVIGTHRLLSKDVEFKKLGLLIIDEEQRFGVRHKETIRKMRSNVDTLMLSATPIPRTLHMSLVGIRDISVINTPPMDRRAIRTRLVRFNDYVIQEAVTREIRRNGQVFFIHNRVESIYQIGEYLTGILPKARIAIAHGQMGERVLENIMHEFINGEYDVLLATTIVESGLDIPNTNTIIINNADQFGLSQLYQLRGRVGRSPVQAYAYLLTPREKILSETAKKRLAILQELNHLGAGFKIANFDLELRGAGNVLGSKQSGHINAVGYELYTEMVEEAVRNIGHGDMPSVSSKSELKMNLGFPGNLPDHYIQSMNQRLDAYKEISTCNNEEELWEIRAALEDRFGAMPSEAISLFNTFQIKLLATDMKLTQLELSPNGELELAFDEISRPDPIKLMQYLKTPTFNTRFTPSETIVVRLNDSQPQAILAFLQKFRKEVY